jgi:hypothetical protein
MLMVEYSNVENTLNLIGRKNSKMLKRTKIQKLFVQFYSNKNKGKQSEVLDGEQFSANDLAPVFFFSQVVNIFLVDGETN